MATGNTEFCSIIITHFHQDDERSTVMQTSLTSLFNNTKYPFELTVVDNGNNDADTEFLLELTRRGKINTYVRNATNMHFGYARNQGLALSDGEYICSADNDIEYKEGWLTKCVAVLEAYPEEKIYSTPIYNVAHCSKRFWHDKVLEVGDDIYRLNSRAGSNCFVARRGDFEEIGRFSRHRVAGTKWTEKAIRLGYAAAITPEILIVDMGFRKGYAHNTVMPIKKVLSDGGEIYFNEDEFKRKNRQHKYIKQGDFKGKLPGMWKGPV